MNTSNTKAMTHSLLWLVALLMAFTSCSNQQYVNTIPSSAVAIMRFNVQDMDHKAVTNILQNVLGQDNMDATGLDLSQPLYAFETIDGNMGLSAKVRDVDDVHSFFNKLAAKGGCTKPVIAADKHFADLGGAWSIGFTKTALVMVGPVTRAALPEMRTKVARMLAADEQHSITSRPLFQCIDTMTATVALASKAVALPEQLAAPITLGAPAGTDPSQLIVAANISILSRHIIIDGHTIATTPKLTEALKASTTVYRKIGPHYTTSIAKDDAFAMLMNVNGAQLLPLIHANKTLQTLLVGLNTAIDFDNILRSVDGDMMMASQAVTGQKLSFKMRAVTTSNPQWLKDVDYWKSSTPKGSTITNMGPKAWCYKSGADHLGFGLRNGEFFASTNQADWHEATSPALKAWPKDIAQMALGARLVLYVNTSGLTSLLGQSDNTAQADDNTAQADDNGAPTDGAHGGFKAFDSLLKMVDGIVYVMH